MSKTTTLHVITLLIHIFDLHCLPLTRITNDCLVSVNEVVMELIGQLGHYM